jgi:predicted NBD/HSP70 family sugar kinase
MSNTCEERSQQCLVAQLTDHRLVGDDPDDKGGDCNERECNADQSDPFEPTARRGFVRHDLDVQQIYADFPEELRARPATGASRRFKEALDRGDPLVADLLDDAVEALAAGIASAVNLLDVDVVVLGGGLADKLGEPFRLRVDSATRPHLFLQPPRVQIVAAELGDEGGAVGAALLARDAA